MISYIMMLGLSIIHQFLQIWLLQFISNIAFLGLMVFGIDWSNSDSSELHLLFAGILLILLCLLQKKKHDILRRYLLKLQRKSEEEKSWKQLIDDLQEGIILIDKNFKIQYKNNTINYIFGI